MTVTHSGTLDIHFDICGPLKQIRFPDRVVQPAFKNELWLSSVCELFIAVPGSGSYLEFNFSPSGDAAFFLFSGYRQRITPGPSANKKFRIEVFFQSSVQPGAFKRAARFSGFGGCWADSTQVSSMGRQFNKHLTSKSLEWRQVFLLSAMDCSSRIFTTARCL